MEETVTVSGVRTPFGTFGGSLVERRKARYGLATMGIGGGMGGAMVFERPK